MDGPIGPIRDGHRTRPGAREKIPGRRDVVVEFGETPIHRRRHVPNHQASAFGIEIGVIRRDSEIDVDGGEIGMEVDAAELAVVLEAHS